ncbi:hypothetical protein B1T45_06850 [Mycobacterium kansasii]|nr:hypothetical protein B1T45_06850 [Mycobacterium kansasii]
MVGNANNGVAAGADGSLNIATAATVVGADNGGVVAGSSGDTNIATAATVVGDRSYGGCGWQCQCGDGGDRGF